MNKASNHPFALGALALSLVALFTAGPNNASQSRAESGPPPLADELKQLQGEWEGEGAGGKFSISIVGNSLQYRNSAGWYKTTFTLPAGTEPRQLHATIKECSPPSIKAIGTVVYAIFKIEHGTLLLAEDDMSDKPPRTFASASSRYSGKRVQRQEKQAEAPISK